MRIPHIVRIGALVLATTGFYAYVGQMVPQKEVQPPQETSLAGVDARAMTRVPGLNDIEYLAQSMYEPTAFVVPGFPPAMPPINKPPIALTDSEILCVIAYLQSLGGTPTVTLQTKHHYNSGAAAPASAPASGPAGATTGAAAVPSKGMQP